MKTHCAEQLPVDQESFHSRTESELLGTDLHMSDDDIGDLEMATNEEAGLITNQNDSNVTANQESVLLTNENPDATEEGTVEDVVCEVAWTLG